MKQFIIMFLSLSLLSGCSFSATEIKIESSQTSTPQTWSEILAASVTTILDKLTPSSASSAKDMWMEAYAKAIINVENKPRHITLVDVDFDGVPEVFLSSLGTSNTWIYQGFTYKEERIIGISVPNEFMPIDLELYQDKETKALFWLASGMYRGSPGHYDYIWFKIDFSNTSAVTEDFFFGWQESLSIQCHGTKLKGRKTYRSQSMIG